MSAPGESLADFLRLEGTGPFTASLESFWGGSACGDLIARGVLACGDRAAGVTSIHTSFFGHAPPDEPLALEVEVLSPDHRRVRVTRAGQGISESVLRSGTPSVGLSYATHFDIAAFPHPESLARERDTARAEGWEPYAVGPVESRRVSANQAADWIGWLAPRAPLGDDPALHRAALTFLSEYRSHWSIERRLGDAFPKSQLTLLDHAVHFHSPPRWDDYLLVRTASDVGTDGLCFNTRDAYTRKGDRVFTASWAVQVTTPEDSG